MLKWEKKLIEFLERHMLLLAALLISLIALYLRRANIWYHTEDCYYYFDSHEGNIQSALYYLMVKLVGYGFELPLHGVKWIAGIADFGVALLAVFLCAEDLRKTQIKDAVKESNTMKRLDFGSGIKLLALYAACLFAPTIYVRGCVWAQIDSVAMAFLLAAVCCREYFGKKGTIGAIVLAAVAAALYPPFMLLVIWYCLREGGEEAAPQNCGLPKSGWLKYVWLKKAWLKYAWLAVAVVAVVIELLSSIAIGNTWQSGVESFLQWTTWHPQSGVRYTEVGEWMWKQLLLFAYGGSVLSLLGAFRRKTPCQLAIIIQLVTMLCFSVALGWQYSV